jgi:hypothetical protein
MEKATILKMSGYGYEEKEIGEREVNKELGMGQGEKGERLTAKWSEGGEEMGNETGIKIEGVISLIENDNRAFVPRGRHSQPRRCCRDLQKKKEKKKNAKTKVKNK